MAFFWGKSVVFKVVLHNMCHHKDIFVSWDTYPNQGFSYLVGGIPTPLKNMKVSWDDYSQYMEK